MGRVEVLCRSPIAFPLLAGAFWLPLSGVAGQHVTLVGSGVSLQETAANVSAGDPVSTEGAASILLPLGARSVGMGRAVTAFRGAESAFWNPAGLARIQEGRFVVLRGDNLVGEATAFSLILARQPLGTLALSYQLLDIGDQDFLDREGNVLGTVTFRDHLGIVSFATQLFPWIDTGVNFKVFQTRLTCQGQCDGLGVTGTTYLLDAGILAEPVPQIPVRLGVMVAHAGPDLQINNAEQADPPPTRIRAAAAYELLHHFLDRPDMSLWATFELEDRLLDLGSPVEYYGAEFEAGETDKIYIRAGYGRIQTGQPEIGVGLGIKYQQFEVGFGKALSSNISDQSEPVQVTFGVIF